MYDSSFYLNSSMTFKWLFISIQYTKNQFSPFNFYSLLDSKQN